MIVATLSKTPVPQDCIVTSLSVPTLDYPKSWLLAAVYRADVDRAVGLSGMDPIEPTYREIGVWTTTPSRLQREKCLPGKSEVITDWSLPVGYSYNVKGMSPLTGGVAALGPQTRIDNVTLPESWIGTRVMVCRDNRRDVWREKEMLTADEVMEKYYLDMRCMLVEIGAMLDRFDRAAENGDAVPAAQQSRLRTIYQGLNLLAEQNATADRSERLLHLFSDPN